MDPAGYGTDGEAGFVKEFMCQTAAKEKGPADSVTPQVAILFDVKNSGEASHRPALRIPPLAEQRYGPKIKMVMERFGAPEPDPATGQAVPTINSSDVFLVMNGGKEGNQTEFMKPFVGAKKYMKNIALYRGVRNEPSWKGPGLCNVELPRDLAGCAGRQEQSEEGDLQTLSDMQHTLEHGGPDRHAAFPPGMAFAMENQEGALRQSPHNGRGTGARRLMEHDCTRGQFSSISLHSARRRCAGELSVNQSAKKAKVSKIADICKKVKPKMNLSVKPRIGRPRKPTAFNNYFELPQKVKARLKKLAGLTPPKRDKKLRSFDKRGLPYGMLRIVLAWSPSWRLLSVWV